MDAPFTPPKLPTFLNTDSARRLEAVTMDAVHGLMFNNAFFSKRDLQKKLGDIFAALNIPPENHGAAMMYAVEKLRLVPVFPGQPDNEWSKFTTMKMVALEREMVEMAKATSTHHRIPDAPDAFNTLVSEAFASRPTMADEQKAVVLASCVTDNNVVITEGTAGAGKSFSLNAIREVYERVPSRTPDELVGYDIIGTALSWTATKVLEESAGLSGGMAIAGLLKQMKAAAQNGKDFFKRRTVIVVDEAGLAPTESVHEILFFAQQSKHDVRVILTGDSLQLNPVQAGNALELLVEECGSTRLDTIRRQKQESHRQAVKHFCFGRAENGLYTYHQQEAVHFLDDREATFGRVVMDYVKYTTSFPQKTALVLALKNADVAVLNARIRDTLKRVGRVAPTGVTVKTWDGKQVKDTEFCVGDQIVFRQNAAKHPVHHSEFSKAFEAAEAQQQKNEEKKTFFGLLKHSFSSWPKAGDVARQGVFNRTIGTILDIRKDGFNDHEFRILLAEGGEVFIKSRDFQDHDTKAMPMTHNFATTIYASQGQTVPRVFMIDDPSVNRKLAYVGASRHTELFDLYVDCSELNARIRKKISFEREKALKKIKQEQQRHGGTLLAEAEESRLATQYPSFPDSHRFTEREYLGVVASAWNTPSLNQTVTMARKQRGGRVKRDPSWTSPLAPWYLSLNPAPEDNAFDHPEPRHPKLGVLAEKQATPQKKTFLSSIFSNDSSTPSALEILPAAQPPELPLGFDHEVADLEFVSPSHLTNTQGTLWRLNRTGEARVFGNDPHNHVARSQYTLDGNLVLGDGELPVFPNQKCTPQTPFFVVHSFREAAISHAHYREKFADTPHLIPHVVIVPPSGGNLSSLLPWLPPKPTIFVTHGKRDGSLELAQQTGARLEALGIPFEYRPKINVRPTPSRSP
jgi:ATP-dependent exoDNAse (exonuclease V) alpha subunit